MKLFKRNKIYLSPGQKKIRNKEISFAVISGILLGVSFTPFPFSYFSFFALIAFFYVLEKRDSLASINRFSYVTFFIFNVITLYWIGSWTKETDPFLMISGVLLLFFNPLFYLIITTIYYFSKRLFGKKTALLLFPLYWVFFEYLYSVTDLRFPWLTLGNSLAKFILFIQSADVVGVYGLSLIILYINIFIYLGIKNYSSAKKVNLKYLSAGAFIFLVVLIYGIVQLNTYKIPQEKIKVGLIQPNLNPWDKWKEGNISSQLDIYFDLSQKAIDKGAQIIIWPESALPVYLLSGNYDIEVGRIRQFVFSKNIYLLTGMPDANFYINQSEAPPEAKKTSRGTTYTSYNSILLFSPNTLNIQKYGKIKLVPFGEHVPFVEQFPFLGDFIKWEVGISSWNVGKEQTVFEIPQNKISVKVAAVVCIESIYPEFISDFIKKGANVITVVTNDSWYGYSSGPFQHKEISVLRAIENRRFVVRAANGGISCIIDPLGNTISSTKLFTRDFLVGEVFLGDGLTFYTRFSFIIPYLVSIMSLLTIIIFIYKKITKRLI